MNWFNIYGFIYMVAILVPNIIFAVKYKDSFNNTRKNKAVIIFEQIGRYGCLFFMIVNIPWTWFGFESNTAFNLYLIFNTLLVCGYLLIWIFCYKKKSIFKALSLSIIPSVIFLFSGIMLRSSLLVMFALIFAPFHILLSYKNAKATL